MFRTNISAGELFELFRPAALVVSVLLSTWVLASAQKRFAFFTSLLWAIGTLLLPMIVGPLYLTIILIKSRSKASLKAPGRRWAISLAYAAVLTGSLAIYLTLDNRSVDAHLARANQAKLKADRAATIREYRLALAIENDAHTHKLLAIELADAGEWQEALSEFRLAEKGGEADDSIPFQLGLLLEKLNMPNQAELEFRKFLVSESCVRPALDYRCQAAQDRVNKPR